jgi:hypothetical protein
VRFLNQYYAETSLKIFFQQYRPEGDIAAPQQAKPSLLIDHFVGAVKTSCPLGGDARSSGLIVGRLTATYRMAMSARLFHLSRVGGKRQICR